MNLVLDASAAVEIALGGHDAASFRQVLLRADMVLVPDTYASEITNVFWKYHALSKMPVETCIKGIHYCLDLADDFIETKPLCAEVFSESARLKHSAYDIFYLIAARRNHAALLTKDKKLRAKAEMLNIKVIEKSKNNK